MCIQFKDKLLSCRNFNPAFIEGSQNLRALSNKDHAATDMHRRAMALLHKSQSTDIIEYAPIASPHRSTHASPHGSTPASPHGLTPASPHGSTPASLHRSTRLRGVDPWGLAGVDPWGLAGVDPWGLAGVDPWGLAGVDPWGLAGVDPWGLAGVDLWRFIFSLIHTRAGGVGHGLARVRAYWVVT